MSKKKIITRFAPSPTGFLHIGGARTALFNWLFSRHNQGEFRLRIEDTDKTRSTPQATQAILDGMSWLGLEADGDIIYQSQNAEAHIRAAMTLLETGHAYRCYCTADEIETLRQQARTDGVAFRSPWRDHKKLEDKPYAIRFKVPPGQTHIHDHVQGDITWDNAQFDDLILLRTDGTPTYMLAVVVDDHDMGITHIIRGDDHLINAGRQQLIYQALGWPVPEWIHVPLIHGPDGKKLSKRHGSLGVEAYRDMGYLPEGLRNYLLKLGWAFGDQELFFDDEAIKSFTLDGLNESPARLDFDKMNFINGQHLQKRLNDELLTLSRPFLEDSYQASLNDELADKIMAAMDSLKVRSHTLKDLAEQARYLMLKRPLALTGKTRKSLKKAPLHHVKALTLRLKRLENTDWTQENIHKCLEAYISEQSIGFGKIGQPIRAAVTGGEPSPDLSLVLTLLGREETIGRLSDMLEEFEAEMKN